MADASVETAGGRPAKPAPIARDWIAKTLAGLLLGLGLALSSSGLLAALLPEMPLPVSGQLVMWLVPPVWLMVLSLVYFFASGLRAWVWLGVANALVFGVWRLALHGSAA